MIGMVWGQLQSRSTIVFPEADLSFERDANVAMESRKWFARLTDRVCGTELTKRRMGPVFQWRFRRLNRAP